MTLSAEYPVTLHAITCHECGGEGQIEAQDPGPYSPTAIEPRWSVYECDECSGHGTHDIERCARCGLASGWGSLGHAAQADWDECQCSEDQLMVWEKGPQNPEVTDAVMYVLTRLDTERHYGKMPPQHVVVARLKRAAHYLEENDPMTPPLTQLVQALRLEAEVLDYPVRSETEEVFA